MFTVCTNQPPNENFATPATSRYACIVELGCLDLEKVSKLINLLSLKDIR